MAGLTFPMRRYFPTSRSLGGRGRQVVPVYRQLLADQLTPVTAFEVLGPRRHTRFCWRASSAARRSAATASSPPRRRWSTRSNEGNARSSGASRRRGAERVRHDRSAGGPAEAAARAAAITTTRDLPAFTGGLVGYAGYDTIRYYEGEKLTKPAARTTGGCRTCSFGLYDELVDLRPRRQDDQGRRQRGRAERRSTGDVEQPPIATPAGGSTRSSRACSSRRRRELGRDRPDGAADARSSTSNLTREQFEARSRKGKEYIKAGDIFQFVPSQRLRVADARPTRSTSTARCGSSTRRRSCSTSRARGCTLIGSAPEILVPRRGRRGHQPPARRHAPPRRDRGRRPGAGRGTAGRPQGAGRAHHAGRPAPQRRRPRRRDRHACKLDDVMTVERYSHVMHITSQRHRPAAPTARPRSTPCARACRSGTVSGAPKIRAMQIIDELEPTRRGPYGGAVGYIDFAGNMDTCIALRTIVWKQRRLRRPGRRRRRRRLASRRASTRRR